MGSLHLSQINNREVRKTARLFIKAGCSLSFTGSGHVAVRKGERLVTVLPRSPSDHRGLLNAISDARKNGVSV